MFCPLFNAAFLLAVSLYIPAHAFAQERISAQDKVISSTFKTLAKGFVAVADIDKLKASNIKKIDKMDEGKFNKRYAKVYKAIKDLPSNLKISYGITENMTKERAINIIESLNKGKIYEMIDSLPDAFIAERFKQYISEKKQEIQKSNLVVEINKLWSKIIEKARGGIPNT